MNQITYLPSVALPDQGRPDHASTALVTDENRRALDRYFDIRCIARGLQPGSRRGRRRIVERFLHFCQRPVWAVLPQDYDRFIAERVLHCGLALSTQRYYQAAIRNFFAYLEGDREYQADLNVRLQQRVTNPITDDNCIVHRTPAEHRCPRYAMTRAQVAEFFDTIAQLRNACPRTGRRHRRRWAIERDRIAFALQYLLALRVGEVVRLDIDAFVEAPWAPALGRYALVRVVGKGTPGQGPKYRSVPATTLDVRILMEWYLENVRPHFRGADTSKALFLTSYGKRVGRSHLIHAFKQFARAAFGETTTLTTHSLRRSGVTHDVERADMEFGRQKAGHVFQATTQIYVQIPPEEVQRQQHDLVQASLRNAQRHRVS